MALILMLLLLICVCVFVCLCVSVLVHTEYQNIISTSKVRTFWDRRRSVWGFRLGLKVWVRTGFWLGLGSGG